jgi:superfamily II DNA or RNA helicase
MKTHSASALVRRTVGARVTITVDTSLTLHPPLPQALHADLLTTFTLPNPAFVAAQEHGRWTGHLPQTLSYYDEGDDGALVLPRGTAPQVYGLCQQHGVQVTWQDHTHAALEAGFTEHVVLSEAQERAVQQVVGRRMGVLVGPPGAGKTVMGMAIIARRAQPALWIVHTKELAQQAVARAGLALGLAPEEIGFVGNGTCTIGARLTVALVQTLARGIPRALLAVGHVVVDEAHRTPCEQMTAVVRQLPARYLLGLTATPYRRDHLDQVIFWHLGPITARMDKADLPERLVHTDVIRRHTGFAPWGESFTALVSQLVADPERNALICSDVAHAVRAGHHCLVLTDRVEHVETLTAMLKDVGLAAAALHGQMPKGERQATVAALDAGTISVVVATGQLIGEGFDCPQLSALFLATPLSYAGRLIQYLGRISRSADGKRDTVVVDYVDNHGMLVASSRKRAHVYAAQGLRMGS